MGQIHRFLGLEVGCIQNDMDDFERQTAYAADITYGTNNEFGFDYLRDNMKFDLATCVQRGHYFAIVDEVDSILIDEARTPLIISGPSDEATDKYYQADAIVPQLKRGEDVDGVKTGDYIVDEKAHTAVLTEDGVDKAERLLGVGNSLRSSQHGFAALRRAGPQGAHPVPARSPVCRSGQQSNHRRRLYRTSDGRSPLVGWPAPGGGSQRGR